LGKRIRQLYAFTPFKLLYGNAYIVFDVCSLYELAEFFDEATVIVAVGLLQYLFYVGIVDDDINHGLNPAGYFAIW